MATFLQKAFFDQFWTLGCYDKQSKFLSEFMTYAPPKRRYTKNTLKQRTASWFYRIDFMGKQLPVCQTFIVNLLQIGRSRLKSIQSKLIAGEPLEDKRGKSKPKPKITSTER